MKLSEWDNTLSYAKKVSEQYGIGCRTYMMHDGKNGINFYLVDAEGKQFGAAVSTGICDSCVELKKRIDLYAKAVAQNK